MDKENNAKKEVSNGSSSKVEMMCLERSCRVCRCAESDKRGDAALEYMGIASVIDANSESESEIMEFVGPDGEIFECKNGLEIALSHEDTLIPLGCSCKDELAMVHYACALKWFAHLGSTICEICENVAINIRTSDVKKVVDCLKIHEALRESALNGEPVPSQNQLNAAMAGIRRQQLTEIARWFTIRDSNSDVDSVSEIVSDQPLNNVVEEAGPVQNRTINWGAKLIDVLLAAGLLCGGM
jgi:hypothetical protein